MATGQAAQNATMPGEPAAGGGVSHQAFFYRGQRDYLARIGAFADAGLATGEPVFIAVPGRNGSILREHLGGRVRYADMTELGRNPARIIPELQDFIDAHPGQRVRFVGEPIWPGRSPAEMCEAARHEVLIDLAFSGMPVRILCPYDAAGLPSSVLSEAERIHRSAGPGDVRLEFERPLPAPPASAETLGYETDLQPVRRLVASHARRAGLPGERAGDLVLAASELAANTLRHTGAGGTVRIWHTQEEILCQVQDQGWISDPLAGRIRHPPDERGHGLWVVNRMCDLVELRTGRGGTTTRLHMSIREP
jgi:anti-sigma regulatory factor (Ser/Thr protein kinase)